MNVHCIPNNDEREHDIDANCWCEPDVTWIDPDTGALWASGGFRATHNAADCRELAEGDGTELAPGKDWSVVED